MGDPFKRKVKPRVSWDEHFTKIAMAVAERSTCRRHKAGAVLVKDKRVLTTGYNGAAKGLKDCIELGCLRDEQDIESGKNHETCRAIHAEQNVIIQAALHGVNIEESTIYCTLSPCILCAKMLTNAGVKKFVTYGSYPDQVALDHLQEAGIVFVKIDKPAALIDVVD